MEVPGKPKSQATVLFHTWNVCLIRVCVGYNMCYTFTLDFLTAKHSFIIAVNHQTLTQYFETFHQSIQNSIRVNSLHRNYVKLLAEYIYTYHTKLWLISFLNPDCSFLFACSVVILTISEQNLKLYLYQPDYQPF